MTREPAYHEGFEDGYERGQQEAAAENQRLKLQNDMIFTDAAGLTQAVDALATANKELRAEVERLSRKLEHDEGCIARLEKHCEDADADAERLRAQWTETIVQLNNLQNAYDVLMARHAALESKP